MAQCQPWELTPLVVVILSSHGLKTRKFGGSVFLSGLRFSPCDNWLGLCLLGYQNTALHRIMAYEKLMDTHCAFPFHFCFYNRQHITWCKMLSNMYKTFIVLN